MLCSFEHDAVPISGAVDSFVALRVPASTATSCSVATINQSRTSRSVKHRGDDMNNNKIIWITPIIMFILVNIALYLWNVWKYLYENNKYLFRCNWWCCFVVVARHVIIQISLRSYSSSTRTLRSICYPYIILAYVVKKMYINALNISIK